MISLDAVMKEIGLGRMTATLNDLDVDDRYIKAFQEDVAKLLTDVLVRNGHTVIEDFRKRP